MKAERVKDPEHLRSAILESLSRVIDPETGADVVRMRLIEDLSVDDDGHVSFQFRPSSALCPLAIPLSLAIRSAVAEVEGVTSQDMRVVGYIKAEDLTELIRQIAGTRERSKVRDEGNTGAEDGGPETSGQEG
jgi:metal-sulfur cluster biosynthetic enzyme